ncbi:hypothetical protein LYNGBM3L_07430 [Moorena producens 3L]|uniref:Uncharacterized protein n=1 Tax=Moorena producens 3L TaxID=489825 RepID=F4XJA3_9CYAN|nr:hypothetical protein LYNGBM3L_07430 [Moorena producens 3L]
MKHGGYFSSSDAPRVMPRLSASVQHGFSPWVYFILEPKNTPAVAKQICTDPVAEVRK